MKNTTHISVVKSAFFQFDGLAIHYAEQDIDGQLFVAKPIVLEKTEKGTALAEPLMKLGCDTAQQLMNQLWVAGIRPSDALRDPLNTEHLDGEVNWLRGVADHLMKRSK